MASIFRWQGYLLVAETLLLMARTSPDSEALLRSAISRAYYAAFNLTRESAADKDGVKFTFGGDVHSKLILYYRTSPGTKRREIGRKLRTMRTRRNIADYDSTYPNLWQEARRTISDAHFVINAIARM